MKETVTYMCSHEGEVELFGPRRQRDQRIRSIERYELCPDCLAKKRAEEAAAAAEKNAENGLPSLSGTEKQVAWAEQIRAQAVETMSAQADQSRQNSRAPENAIRSLDLGMQKILANTSAAWWIENRSMILTMYQRACREAYQALEAGQDVQTEQIYQHEPSKPGTVKVVVKRTAVREEVAVFYPKDPDLREYVKGEGFMWLDGAWRRGTADEYDTIADLAAATVNDLVAIGFAVATDDQETKDLLRTHSWTASNPRIITMDGGRFAIQFEDNDETRALVTSLPHAFLRDDGTVRVPAAMADAVAELAATYGFNVASNAQDVLDKAAAAERVAYTPADKTADLVDADAAATRTEADLSDLIDTD